MSSNSSTPQNHPSTPTKMSGMKKFGITLIVAFVIGIIPAISITASQFPSFISRAEEILGRTLGVLKLYQNLANPYMKYVRIPEGLRKEEVANIYEKVLAWSPTDRTQFLDAKLEGFYFPDTYFLPIDASGVEVRNVMLKNFDESVKPTEAEAAKHLASLKNKINIETVVKIASLIQREAAGKNDMKIISGIIWNRLFNGMSLDLDATLQYAKGTDEAGWWPQVVPKDKKIVSPYNTYKNKGLPPSAIANPGIAAIEAAYNPIKTDKVFYFHDSSRNIHTSKTYKEHVAKIEQYLK